MKKSEAEPMIRALTNVWREATELQPPDGAYHYSFSDFKTWLGSEGYSRYLDFRSSTSADDDAERWFDQEIKQARRN
jgi:hypothetical protein